MWTFFLLGLLSPFIFAELNNKPILQDILIPKNLKENQTARLLCSIEKGEGLNFEWYLNDQKLETNEERKILFQEDSSILVIKSLSVDDIGEVKCIAKNQYGQDIQRSSIFFDVKPKFIKEPNDLMDLLSKEITVECTAKGYPTPIIKWFKLDVDKQTVIKELGQLDILKFYLTKENAGFYKCIVSNSIGKIEKIINIGFFVMYNEQ